VVGRINKFNPAILATFLAVAATVFLLTGPVYVGHGSSTRGDSKVIQETVTRSLPEVNGWFHSYVMTSIPIVLSVVPLAWPTQQKRAAYALLVFVVFCSMSIGLFYAPAAATLLLWKQRARPPSS
jgi:hypothetical protein